MAILTSLYTGVTGLNSNGTALSVIGDNIANMNTVGFKSSRASFADILGQSILGASNTSQIGRGVSLQAITPLFVQGSFETTASGLDLAINGKGFFVVDNNGVMAYSRAGQFSVDKDGDLVNPDGLNLQGYTVSAAGVPNGALSDINVSTLNSPPNPTANAEIDANLDAGDTAPVNPFDPNDITSYNFSSSVNVYDTLGVNHQITMYYEKTGPNAWQWHAVADGAAAATASGPLTFDSSGRLTNGSPATVTFDFSATGASAAQAIAFDLGTPAPGGTGLDGITQFGSPSETVALNQDGYASGSLINLNVANDGIITGIFSNGQTRPVAQIALARFSAPEALLKIGNNLYFETFDSGQPLYGNPGQTGLGELRSNALELSNTDLANEFVSMIAAQRGFQANSKVITTTDDVLDVLVNIKR